MSVTPPSAAAVIESWEVLDLLASLVHKSLVVYEEDEQGRGRYRLLETVRQYARDRLLQAGEVETLRARHLEFCLAMAEQAEPELRGPDQATWFHRLEAEHDNLRASLQWSTSPTVAAAHGLRLVGALWWFWAVRHHWQEGTEWLTTLLQRPDTAAFPVERAKALAAATDLTWDLGENERSAALAEQSLALFREVGHKWGISLSLNLLGRARARLGDWENAVIQWKESLTLARELSDRWLMARSLESLSASAERRGNNQESTALLEESLAFHREMADIRGIALCTENLGWTAWGRGHLGQAERRAAESAALFREVGERWCLAGSLNLWGLAVL